MSAAVLDVAVARRELAAARKLGLAPAPARARAGVPKVADILFCTFDTGLDAFRVVYTHSFRIHETGRYSVTSAA